jgi:hypothetical protein
VRKRRQRYGRIRDGVNVMTPRAKTWRRLAGRRGRDRNPLRRRSDLIEAWLLPAVVTMFLAVGPFVAGAVSQWIHADAAAARHAQLSWHRVSGVLLAAAPGPMMTDDRANSWIVWTPARWTADGRPQQGRVPAAAGARAGSMVTVWLDRSGQVQRPPLTAGQADDRVVVGVAMALTALAVLLAGLAWLGQRVLDWRRLAGWETAWLSVGPQWSRQR